MAPPDCASRSCPGPSGDVGAVRFAFREQDGRKEDRERAALIGRAVDRQIPAQHDAEGLADGEAEPRSAELARRRGIGLAEPLEEARQLLLRHPDAGIGDPEHQPVAAAVVCAIAWQPHRRQRDRAVLGELRRVAQEVEQDLPKLGDVGMHRAEARLHAQCEFVALLGHESLHGRGHVARHRLDIEGLREDLHLAALDLGQVEHVVDQAEQVARIALDLAHVLGQRRRVSAVADLFGQHFAIADDGRERRAQFMAHVGDEGALGEVRLLGGVAGRPDPLFGLTQLGDVGVGAEPAQDTTLRVRVVRGVVDRQRTRQEPTIEAIRPAQRERIVPGHTAGKGLSDALDDASPGVGMNQVLPAPALHLVQSRPREVVPAPIVPVDRPVRPGHPGELRHRVGEAAELRFALPQRVFGAAALGPAPHALDRCGTSVGGSGTIGRASGKGDHAAGRRAGVLNDRERGIFGDEGRPILPPQEFVVEPHGPPARHRMEQRAGCRRIVGAVRAGMMNHLVHVAAQKFIGRCVTQHAQRGPVHEGAGPGRVDAVDSVAEPVEEVPLHRSVASGEADRGGGGRGRRTIGQRSRSSLLRCHVGRRRHR